MFHDGFNKGLPAHLARYHAADPLTSWKLSAQVTGLVKPVQNQHMGSGMWDDLAIGLLCCLVGIVIVTVLATLGGVWLYHHLSLHIAWGFHG